MKHRRYWVGAITTVALVGGIWAATGATASTAKQSSAKLTKVTLQLKWVTQAQFAGYYAAAAKGYHRQAGLDVKIKVGGPDIVPEQVVAGGQAEFGLDWLPSLMSARDQGTKLINIAQKFLTASFRGWIYCRDHSQDCVRFVLAKGPTLLKGHQTWQMNEINALVWPAPKGIGIMDAKVFARSAKTTTKFNHLKKLPGHEAYRDDLAKAAVAQLRKQGVDVNGRSWKKATVKITPGGK